MEMSREAEKEMERLVGEAENLSNKKILQLLYKSAYLTGKRDQILEMLDEKSMNKYEKSMRYNI